MTGLSVAGYRVIPPFRQRMNGQNVQEREGWEVYIIESEGGALYTGMARDARRRFQEHRHGRRGARFFRFSAPRKLLWIERLGDRSSAARREIEIKKLTRLQKMELIRGRQGHQEKE